MNNEMSLVCLGGATFNVVEILLDKGQTPNLQRLINKGVITTLISTDSYHKSSRRAYFLTGKIPDYHGIKAFTKIYRSTEEYVLVDSTDLECLTLYEAKKQS